MPIKVFYLQPCHSNLSKPCSRNAIARMARYIGSIICTHLRTSGKWLHSHNLTQLRGKPKSSSGGNKTSTITLARLLNGFKRCSITIKTRITLYTPYRFHTSTCSSKVYTKTPHTLVGYCCSCGCYSLTVVNAKTKTGSITLPATVAIPG